MKTLLILIALGWGGYHVYHYMSKPSEAAMAYEQYADAMARGKMDIAKGLATGTALSDLEVATQPAPPIANPTSMMGIYQKAMAPQNLQNYKRNMINEIAGDITGIKYKINSETKSSDKTKVTLSATQFVSRYRSGDRVIGGGVVNQFKHDVELSKEGGAWKVASFKEESLGNR